jgi:uncharacterized protein (TIGR00269 family)
MKCSSCGKRAVYYRANEGRYYCKQHLIKNIEKRVKRTISKNNLVEKNDRIAVALSGGKDSSNTLFLLNKIFGKYPDTKIFALTIDEGIKGYRNKSIKIAKKFCQELGIEHFIASFKDEFNTTVDKIASKIPFQYCTFCGVMRRYLLNKKVRELGATKLATGCNLDDEAQSVIMNMIKGDFLRLTKLGPKPTIISNKKFVLRIKPLIEIPERESAIYALINNIPCYMAECPYSTDNPFRQETGEFLNKLEERSPGIKFGIVKNAYKIIPIIEKKLITGKVNVCKECGEPSSGRICRVCSLLALIDHV